MSDKKLSFKQISIAWTGATFATVTTGGVFAGLMDWPIIYTAGWAWFGVVGVSSMIAATDTLSKTLGKKEPTTVSVINGSNRGRKTPINYANGRRSHVYLSELILPWLKPEPSEVAAMPKQFPVFTNGKYVTVTLEEMDYFIRKASNVERAGRRSGLSRDYWTTIHNPRFRRDMYDARIKVLESCQLIADREAKRSGRLILPPGQAIKTLQSI